MDIISELALRKSTLKREISHYLRESYELTYSRCKGEPQEPDFIASLCLEFTKDLYHYLSNRFPFANFSISGIFCHQKPIAIFKEKQKPNPEIGDLLIVFIVTDKDKKKTCNSLLFQAKRSITPYLLADEDHQLKLYTEWPIFSYARAGKDYSGIEIDIHPKSIHQGASYLIINDYPFNFYNSLHCPFGIATPSKHLMPSNNFANTITNFLTFQTGRAFIFEPEEKNRDWDRLITDLIKITKGKASKRTNSGLKKFPRNNEYSQNGIAFHLGSSSSIFSFIEKLPIVEKLTDDNELNDEINGVSIILIESFESSE